MLLIMIACTALFVAGTVSTYRDRGWTWVSAGLALMVAFGLGGIVEALVVRIELTDDAMVVTDLRGRRRYAKAGIDRVAEAKGSAPILLLKDGQRVRLPSAGDNVGNSVRAWLKPS